MNEISNFCKFLSQEKVKDVKFYSNDSWINCIVGTVTSFRHINSLIKKLKGLKKINKSSVFGSDEWVILDAGDFDVHLFTEFKRSYYDLDTLWSGYGK